MIRRLFTKPLFRSITNFLLLQAALLVGGAAAASAVTGICHHDCSAAWLQCYEANGCRNYGGCLDGSICQNGHCRNGRSCGTFPEGCGFSCTQARSACMEGCPDTYLVAIPQGVGLLGLEDALAIRLLEPIGEADRALDRAIGGAAPVVGKMLGAYREQLRLMAGKELSKADALRLEQPVLELEATLAGDGLKQYVSGLLEPKDIQVRASGQTNVQAGDTLKIPEPSNPAIIGTFGIIGAIFGALTGAGITLYMTRARMGANKAL
jgi:hypothetical protein